VVVTLTTSAACYLVTEATNAAAAGYARACHERVVAPLTMTIRQGETWEKDGRSGRLRFSEQIMKQRGPVWALLVTAPFCQRPRLASDRFCDS
jgi:hypothetical protein